MAFRKRNRLTSWSFSRYSDYSRCPFKTKLKHLAKISEPKNAAMTRGGDVHTSAEHYLKGFLKKLPVEAKLFTKLFNSLRTRHAKHGDLIIEETWAFTKNWERTRWDDWDNCWLRIKLDCGVIDEQIMIIYDWKTGKFRVESATEYTEQMELYALGALLINDKVEQVRPRLVYLDAGQLYPEIVKTYTRDDLEDLKKKWQQRVRPMMNDIRFAPRPNRFCSWCHYRASNKSMGGGQCRY